jgi:hypothetical protein
MFTIAARRVVAVAVSAGQIGLRLWSNRIACDAFFVGLLAGAGLVISGPSSSQKLTSRVDLCIRISPRQYVSWKTLGNCSRGRVSGFVSIVD